VAKTNRTGKAPISWLQKRIGQIASSGLAGRIANFPPVAWAARVIARTWARRNISSAEEAEPPVARPQEATGVGLEATLWQIVHDVVDALGYAGAMVATYEQGDALPVRAFYVDPSLTTVEQIQKWEQEVSKYSPQPVSITDPDIARVYVYEEAYQDNLSARAFKAEGPVVSDDLYDLFRPIAPPASAPVVKGIQQAIGIRQVIATPFFLETCRDGQPVREMVGNLFVAKRGEILKQDVRILSAFGHQAAAAIESEHRRLQIRVAQELVFDLQSELQNEERILQRIVQGIVSDLGYVGAMVATYEPDDSLPVRVFYVDPSLVMEKQVHAWEREISKYSAHMVSITDPEIAKVLVHYDEYQDNLSIRALKAGGPVVSDDLYDLFRPVAPAASRPAVEGIQQALGVRQVIAIPFFLKRSVQGQARQEIVGNLFAATRSRKFSAGEIELLQAFGQQAAAGIRNARLYRQVEERRRVAQVFGKIAFSAAASVHVLRNHIGAFQTLLHLVKVVPPERHSEIMGLGDEIAGRLDESVEILNNLHEPWHQTLDVPTDINGCLTRATRRVIPDGDEIRDQAGIVVHTILSDDLPSVKTSPDMLTEAFRVLIKNAVEAIQERDASGELRIRSCLGKGGDIEVQIADNGIGIRPKDLSRIFEMRWSTKEAGMGFGLFWTKEYIEGLGGSIQVRSVWQEGTTFEILIPSFSAQSDVP
jgi:signal transduction histidine kinase